MSFLQILTQMAVLFAMMAVGYIARRCGVMDAEFSRKFSAFVLSVPLPMMIIGAALTSKSLPSPAEVGRIILVAAISYAFLIGAAMLVPILLRIPVNKRGVYRFMLAFGNVGFIGYPVISSVFGPDAVFYTSIFNLPFNLLSYTLGVWFILQDSKNSQQSEDSDAAAPVKAKKLSMKSLISPALVGTLTSLVIVLLGLHFPEVVGQVFTMGGQITTPAALMIVGSTLAGIPVKELFGRPAIYIVSAFRLLVLPVILWFCLRPFLSGELLLGVAVIIAGMPVASNGTMLCLQYNGDTKTMTQGMFLMTVCSIFTIPVLTLLF